MPTCFSIHFGCRANQADAATIESGLAESGFEAAHSSSAADVVVLNSCTVTASADSELRQTVRRIHRENPHARILITGCYAQRRPEELAELPGVKWVVGNSHKAEIAQVLSDSSFDAVREQKSFVPLRNLIGPEQAAIEGDQRGLGSVLPSDMHAHSAPTILVGDIAAQRHFAAAPHIGGAVEDRTRPNLKIQDGCDNRCSFCIIPSVRGLSRSLPVSDVLSQIRALAGRGYREVVLSGVNLGQYGRDLPERTRFIHMVRRILDETPIERLRLSSVEPMDFTDRLLDLMASTPRIAKHVHAPLQSGSDRILRRMHRKYRAAQYRERILAAYGRMPEAAFGADVIVGFPGETDEDFEATRGLIEELPFTYLHVFPFSRRPGTPADTMKDQMNGVVVRERSRLLRELAAGKHLRFRQRQVGRTLRVLTLAHSGGSDTLALSDNYLKVVLPKQKFPPNSWVETRVTALGEHSLVGEPVSFPDTHHPECRSESARFRFIDGAADCSPSISTCASA